ncbi:MAG: long-chain acyl-CoA synthetase [Actinomycetota bacterium]|jgi:long-chain acyl-CoA synthetase|nr:long-chain acyl-CoA synthetase [Actinomycetota bacterium]
MAQTIVDRFFERVSGSADKVALKHRTGGNWKDITWRDYGDGVKKAAKAMIAQGFGHGDKIALLSNNRPEWHIADIACMALGGANAAIYTSNSPDQVAYIIQHSEAKLAFVDTTDQLEKILKVRGELPNLQKVIVFNGNTDADPDFVMGWDEFLATGKDVEDSKFEELRKGVKPEDLATFVYTSGTTGPPKGVMLSHANIWWTAVHSEQSIPIGDNSMRNPDGTFNGRALSYLPLSHIAERMISHLLQVYYGTETWFAESIETLQRDLQECKPTYFFGVPRVWEKFYAAVTTKMAQADPNDRKTKLAKKAVELGKKITELEQEAVARGQKMADAKIPLGTKVQHAALDKLVLHKIRAAFGLEECTLALSAAAPLAPELIWFFHSVGIKITEGYGQSEGNGPTSWNPPDANLIGSVGTPLSGLEVRLAEDGEILVRGGNIMTGYYKDEKATKETIDEDGWLHSGDVGVLNEHNYLKITDRKKDIIITAGGKNIAPQEIENRLKTKHALISQVVVIGDKRPFLTALITLDEEKAPSWGKEQGIEGDIAAIANNERTQKEIEGAINELNKGLAKVEGLKKFRILERDFLQEENEITPTMKVKRKQINEIYGEVIEDLYTKDSPSAGAGKAPLRK